MPLTLLRHATQKPPIGPLKLDSGHPQSAGASVILLLNEYGSKVVNDATGIHATAAPSGTTWVSTSLGPALNFSGSGVVDVHASDMAALTSPWSMGAFVNFNAVAGTQTVICIGNAAGTNQATAIASRSAGTLKIERPGGVNLADSGLTPVAGTWYRVWGTFDGTNHAIYINGVLKNSTVSTDTAATPTLFTLGEYHDGGFAGDSLNGIIADARYYTRCVDAAFIAQDYAEPYAMFQTRPMQRWFTVVSAGGATIPPGLGPVVSLTEPTLTADLSSMMR